jgi:HAD superfamily hydrolase (TIGR01509 family)
MPIQALIFDFDGLILDTETPDYEVLSEQYRTYGAELRPERWVLGLGTFGGYDPYAELQELSGVAIDAGTLHAEHRARYLERCGQQPLRPGVLALLDHAQQRGLKLAIASSGSRDWVEGWVVRHEIQHYFGSIRTRTDVARVKPAPDLFLSAASHLGVAPGAALVLEDSPNGMRAAAAAGMRCVAVPLPLLASLELPPTAMRLTTLADLPPEQLLAQIDQAG